jgi:hypothetical protein
LNHAIVFQTIFSDRGWLIKTFKTFLGIFGGFVDSTSLSYFRDDTTLLYEIAHGVVNYYELVKSEIFFLDLIEYMGFIFNEKSAQYFNETPALLHFSKR